ncbi:MAG: glutamate-5-semialdehyde dehydrogenase [Eubacteriales bacterium]|nr:glutamate-5-semialdehyde dehydrogenase [Eubacteriales bacterium]
MDIDLYITDLCKKAKAASRELATMQNDIKNKVLLSAASELRKNAEYIINENTKDIAEAVKNGMSEALIDRLRLDNKRIEDMAAGIEAVSKLEDPCGKILSENTLENGLKIIKKSVPIGVCGIIYEARPNVTSDAFALCFKSGNACVLKGGSAAINSNIAIVNSIKRALLKEGISEAVLSFIEDCQRESTNKLMKMNEYVDVLIPRGGASLIKSVIENATVPVIETGTGNCHIFVDKSADLDMAVNIILNAKTQRIGVCNACESLLIHRDILEEAVPLISKALMEKNVTIYADEECRAICNELMEASEDDWGREYLDLKISMKAVGSVEEAIAHINRYNTRHSESIITKDMKNAEKFLNNVDAACIYLNASTRFTDGGQFGFGCEIGISTSKLHARGPMGLPELQSYHYEIIGNGQIRE